MNTPLALGTKAWIERLNLAYDRVHATWQQSVEDILALGKELLAARESLAKGEYTNMLHNQLKFGAPMATKLIKIAESPQIFSHGKILPPHWVTLYQLSRLDEPTFLRGVEAGVIRPDMERSEVPAIPRNLSAHGRPLGRPRKLPPPTIEGTATEVPGTRPPTGPTGPTVTPTSITTISRSGGEQENTTLHEPPPPPQSAWGAAETLNERIADWQEEIARLQAENAATQERHAAASEARAPAYAIQVHFSPTDHVRNFWQALLILLGEWEKLGSLDGLVPDEETETLLQQYDLGRVIDELDMLRVALLQDPDAAA